MEFHSLLADASITSSTHGGFGELATPFVE